jgi:hypothetical protein
MPQSTFVEIPPEEHMQILAALRRSLVALLKATPRAYGVKADLEAYSMGYHYEG